MSEPQGPVTVVAEDDSEDVPPRRFTATVAISAAVLVIFAGICVGVFLQGDPNLISAVVQASIALATLVVGSWFRQSSSNSQGDSK